MTQNKEIYDRIEHTLVMIKNVSDDLYRNQFNNEDNELESIVAVVQTIYSFMIKNNEDYARKGIDIPIDILNNQFNNMIDGINNGDYILLADALLYEVSETLNYFVEIGTYIDE